MKLLKKKIDKYNCKWNKPDESAPWEYQECHCPDKSYGFVDTPNFSMPMIFDVSCDHQANSGPRSGLDCPYFEEEEKEKN